jgi:NitT/TauT family transport system substrate-binding protein
MSASGAGGVEMKTQTKRVVLAVTAWLVVVSGLHLWLNMDWSSLRNELRTEAERKLNVAYIPVT